MHKRARLLTLIGAVLLSLLLPSFTQPTVARADDWDWYESEIIKVISKTYIVNYNKKLPPRCNLPCALNSSASVTRSITLTSGLTRSGVSATLGISSADTATVSVSCSAPKQPSRSYLVAYAEGYQFKYRVRQKTYDLYGHLKKTEEMTLVAFDPRGAHCVAE